MTSQRKNAFTLIELLVVISIIGLLVAILLPALAKAREAAQASQSLSNVRQIAIASNSYLTDRYGYFFMHSSDPGTKKDGHKPRWADYLFPYLQEEQVYLSPNLEGDVQRMTKQFWHTVSTMPAEQAGVKGVDLSGAPDATGVEPAFHGGYGFNYQYLGNARTNWVAKLEAEIRAPSKTILVGDIEGSNQGNPLPRAGAEAVYSMDPPVGSLNLGSKGSRGGGEKYYASGSGDTGNPEDFSVAMGADVVNDPVLWLTRSVPAHRNLDAANIGFIDGHAKAMQLKEIDDASGNGQMDHGYWNGLGQDGESDTFR